MSQSSSMGFSAFTNPTLFPPSQKTAFFTAPVNIPNAFFNKSFQNKPEPFFTTTAPAFDNTQRMRIQQTKKTAKTMTAADRAIRFGGSSKTTLYTKLKEERVKERKEAIKNNLMDGPDTKRRLEDAIVFRGTCETKCPPFEILEREIQNGLDVLELNERGEADPDRVVKAYRRSAAGNEQPLPSDVRTPEALLMTLDYLFHQILPNYPLEQCHAFLRDRTRSIRQDFTLQNIRDTTAVIAHEQIARFHILCLHEMCGLDESKFSAQQETEQLRKVLLSLVEFYDDLREESVETPNEAEFRAYFMLINIRDTDICRQAMTLPIHVFRHPYMDKALLFHSLVQSGLEIEESATRKNKTKNLLLNQNWFTRLFKLIRREDTPFLVACLLEYHFPDIRKNALKALNRCFSTAVGGASVEELQSMLGYDSIGQIISDCKAYGLQLDMSLGIPSISFSQKHNITKAYVFREPISNPPPTKSLLLVEPKKHNRSLEDIVCHVEVLHMPHVPTYHTPPTFPINTLKRKDDHEHIKQTKTAYDLQKIKTAAALLDEKQKKLEKMIEEREREKKLELQQKQLEQEKRRQQMEAEMARKKKEEQLKRQLAIEAEKKKRAEERRRLLEVVSKKINRADTKRRNRWIKKCMSHCIDRARDRIHQRELLLHKANPMKRLVKTFSDRAGVPLYADDLICTYNHANTVNINERVKLAYQEEENALYIINECPYWSKSLIKRAESNFIEDLYPRIKDKHKSQESIRWELSVLVADTSLTSSQWCIQQFGLEQPFCRKIHRIQGSDIKVKMYTPDTTVSSSTSQSIGGIFFILPETTFNDDQQWNSYWEYNRIRLNTFTTQINRYNASINVPLVISFFPGSNVTEEMIGKIPQLLQLSTNWLIKDYHFLLMNGPTLAFRTKQELNWLASL